MSASPTQYGEVFDRGYIHYTGPRLGQAHAIWALARYSMARGLGLRRSWTAKIIPLLLYAGAAIPVVVAIGVRAFFPAFEFLDYPGYFAGIFMLQGIFVATVAPEMVSSDRHDNLLPLYFSRPISRGGYVLAKLLATAILTLSISLVPAVVLWLGTGLIAPEPLLALRDSLDDLGRIVVAGTMIALYLGAIALLISSFTSRKSVAVGIILLGFVLSESISLAIIEALPDRPDITQWAFALSSSRTITAMVDALFGTSEFGDPVPLTNSLAVAVGVIVICCLIMFAWYQRRD